MAAVPAAPVPPKRAVGFGLGLGIVFLPWLFSWFTLRAGHGVVARVLAIGWAGATLFMVLGLGALAPRNATGRATSSRPTPEVQATAEEINAAYEENEIAADDRYKGKWIFVSGKVAEISKGPMGGLHMRLAVPRTLIGVNLALQDSEAPRAAKIKRGDAVRAICMGQMAIAKVANLGDCVLAE